MVTKKLSTHPKSVAPSLVHPASVAKATKAKPGGPKSVGTLHTDMWREKKKWVMELLETDPDRVQIVPPVARAAEPRWVVTVGRDGSRSVVRQ
jgi:hypothetical protein